MKSIKDLISTIDLAFVATLSAICGYGLFYCYSRGVNSVYGLPSTFIELDVKGLTLTALAVMGFLFSIYIGLFTARNLREKIDRKSTNVIYIICGLLMLGSAYTQILLDGFSIERLIRLLLILPLVFSFAVILKFKKYSYPVIIFVVLSLALAFLSGRVSAQDAQEHFILNQGENQPYVVVQSYKDNFIIAPVNLKKKIITPKFQVVEMKSQKDKKIEWKRMNTGKLKMKEYVN